MSMFSGITTEGLEKTEDRLGGFKVWPTNVYDAKIKMIYGTTSAGGAKGVVIHLDINGEEYRETVWFTNKQGQNYSEKDGKKTSLPGFITLNEMAALSTGFGIEGQTFEEKQVMIWDRDAGKELPKAAEVITSMLDKPITVAIQQNLEDKSVKQGNEYIPTGETRDTNTIDKCFHTETRRTYNEVVENIDADFLNRWLERNEGKVRNRAKGAGKAGTPGGTTGGAPKAQQSLFNK